MSIILHLIAYIIRIIFRFTFRALSELLGCLVRLLFWSIRAYGWGKVMRVIGTIILGSWLYFYMLPDIFRSIRWLSTRLIVFGIPVLSLAIWYIGKGLIWVSKRVFGKLVSRIHNSAKSKQNKEVISYTPTGQLWEQFISKDNLTRAWKRVEANGGSAGPDNITLEFFSMDYENLICTIQDELSSGKYCPQPPRIVEMPKSSGRIRSIAIFNVRDRIVLQAINQVLIPIWDAKFASCSYAYRPGRSALQAVESVEKCIKDGRSWIVDADIEAFFDSIPHQKLIRLMESWLDDIGVKSLIAIILRTVNPEGIGLSQGSPLSPLLSNLYLHQFDVALLERGYAVYRYADDFIILCPTRQQAESAFQTAQRLLKSLQLKLNEEKTHIIHISEGFTFLGFTFSAEGKRPSDKSIKNLEECMKEADDDVKRKRIENGWQAYFGNKQQDVEGLWIDEDKDKNLLFSESQWEIYRMFICRSDIFAKYWQNNNGQSGYVPIRRPISRSDIYEHISGTSILGTYILDQSYKIKALVFDVDGPEMNETGRQKAHQLTIQIAEALSRLGVSPLIFDSGGKGRHIWLCFAEPIPAKPIRLWAQKFLDDFRPFPEGIFVEVFPKQDLLSDNALGSMIRLPLGRHPKSGRFSFLLDINGAQITDPWTVLQDYSFANPKFLETLSEHNYIEAPEFVAPMVLGCSLLKCLIEKARKSGQLKHTERLALLYTLGHCGDPGKNYIHQIMSACENYDPRITERFIHRLELGHRAIRCSRLREWLKDYLPGTKCECLKGKNSSPLDLIMPGKKAEVRAAPKLVSEQDWDNVSQDMFELESDHTE